MKNLLQLFMAICPFMTAVASVPPAADRIMSTSNCQTEKMSFARNVENTALSSSQEEGFNVTVSLAYDETKFRPWGIKIFNAEFNEDRIYPTVNGENVNVRVPEGTYDIVALYDGKSDSDLQLPKQIFVVLENVAVNSDTDVVADAATATERFKFSSVNPDGKPTMLPTLGEKGVLLEDGNVSYICYVVDILRKGISKASFAVDSFVDTDERGCISDRGADIMVNPLSDNWRLYQTRIIRGKEDSFFAGVKMEAKMDGPREISNSISDYSLSWDEQDKFMHTPAFDKWTRDSYVSEVYIGVHQEKDSHFGVSMLSKTHAKVYLCAPYYSVPGEGDVNMIAQVKALDIDTQMDILGETSWIDQGVQSLPMVQIGDKLEYRDFNIHNVGHKGIYYPIVDYTDYVLIPNSHVGYAYASLHDKFGESAPYCTLFSQVVPAGEGKKIQGMLPDYFGNNGEYRDVDQTNLNIYVERNGEKLFSTKDYYEYFMWEFTYPESGNDPGEIITTYTNSNVKVDGNIGMNMTVARYDERNEDTSVPTVQMVRYSESDNIPSIRLRGTASPKIEIYAGDWEYNNDTRNMDFSEISAIEVEVAPLYSGKFKKLDVTGDASKDFIGWGQYFSVDLSDLDTEGWYDLKIKVTDRAGNYQLQAISPAFKINEVSSVEDLTDGIDQAEIAAVYSLQGVRLDKPVAGQPCIVVMSDGRIRKVMCR